MAQEITFLQPILDRQLHLGSALRRQAVELCVLENLLASYFELLDSSKWFPRTKADLHLFVYIVAINQHFPCEQGNRVDWLYRSSFPNRDIPSLEIFDGWSKLAKRTDDEHVEHWSDLEHWLQKYIPENLLIRGNIIQKALHFVYDCLDTVYTMLSRVTTYRSNISPTEKYVSMARGLLLKQFYISTDVLRDHGEFLKLAQLCIQMLRRGCVAFPFSYMYILLEIMMDQGIIQFLDENGYPIQDWSAYQYIQQHHMVPDEDWADFKRVIDAMYRLVHIWRKSGHARCPQDFHLYIQPLVDACRRTVQ